MPKSRLIVYLIVLGVSFLVQNGETVSGPRFDTDYSDDEIEKLKLLHEEVDNELLEEYMKTDEYLISFIRAKNGDLTKAIKSVRTVMKWRQDNNMNEILNEPFPTFKKQFRYELNFNDKEGRPIIMMYFGRWNLRNAIISGQKAQLMKYFDQMLEATVHKAREIRKEKDIDVNRFMFLVDMNGYSFTTHNCLNCVPVMLEMAIHLETYYAAQAIRIYCINTPRLFMPVFELMRPPLMSEVTYAGFKVFGPDKAQWKPELLKVIHAKDLPVEYGGTATKKKD